MPVASVCLGRVLEKSPWDSLQVRLRLGLAVLSKNSNAGKTDPAHTLLRTTALIHSATDSEHGTKPPTLTQFCT